VTDTTVPKKRRARKPRAAQYDIEQLREKWPSLKTLALPTGKACETAWVAAFTEQPGMVERFLSDIIKQAYAKPGRIGQRPMPREEEVNMEILLNGEFAEELLHVVLPKIMPGSERAFCLKIRIGRRTFQRMLLEPGDPDKFYPDMEILSRVAAGVRKPPAFFMEYRQMAAQAAFIRLITERPGVATRIYREYLLVEKSSPELREP
jgi:hypothetical protein